MPRPATPIDTLKVQQLVRKREALGISQLRLAREAGLSEGIVARVESLRQGLTPQREQMVQAALRRLEQGSPHERGALVSEASGVTNTKPSHRHRGADQRGGAHATGRGRDQDRAASSR